MPKETLTSRERWLAVLLKKTPDRIPMDYWATPETSQKLMAHLECSTEDDMLKKLHVDKVVRVKPEYVGPLLPSGTDVFGCLYKTVDYGLGVYEECIFHPLAEFGSVEEIDTRFKWPDPGWWDYSSLPSQINGKEMHPILGGHFEPFLTYKNLRGQEKAFVDLVENPDIVHYCLDRLFLLGYEEIRRIYEQIPGRVMLTYVAEDMGAQSDLLISTAHIHEFFLPRMERIIELVHQAGAFVFHHNDGSIRRIIPDMIKAGIDILNPIQWRCENMDRQKLKQDFGQEVVFHGAMDNQQTLPFGTADDVKNEVLDNLAILGADGGYILAPCHNIQAITPVENIITMYQTGYESGWT